MHSSSRSFATILLFYAAAASAHARESLCAKDEQIAFSCTVGQKLASLCASADLSKTTGYVQYRYGRKDKVELVFPESKARPRAYFRWGVNGYSGGGTDYFRFSNKGFDYVVYSGIGKGWAKDGIVVEKNGKRLSSQVCKNDALGPDNWAVITGQRCIQRTFRALKVSETNLICRKKTALNREREFSLAGESMYAALMQAASALSL